MKYCQGTRCHEYKTKDRIRGVKGDKHYETRKNSRGFYHNEFCSLTCQNDWLTTFGKRAIDHFGRTHEPKRTDANGAWYKAYDWRSNGNSIHFFVNDLLGEKIAISPAQYRDENYTTPSTS